MINTLIGTKKSMTSTYDARGRRVGATVVEILPNIVSQIKTTETKDGYNAVQLGYGSKKSVKKPQIGHIKKTGVDQKVRWFKEVRVEGESGKGEVENMKPGSEIKLNQVFSIGDVVKITGTSKGKGFAGGVKRWGFAGGPKTHGQSDRHRAPGSIGSGTTPGRVYKGKKMAGHMGNETVSVLNLEVVSIDRKNGFLTVKGGIPGPVGGVLMLTKMGIVKGYTPPPEEKLDEEEELNVNAQEISHAEEQKTEEVASSDVEAMEDKENA